MNQPFTQPIGFDLSGISFAASSKNWMLQRQFNWQLFMPHTINGVFGPTVSSFCQDIKFGNYSIQTLEKMQQGAFQRFYAGLQSIEGVSISFITSVDNSVLDYFYGWYNLMVDEEGFYYPKHDYAKQIYVSLYDRSGLESARFTLKGCFPKNKPSIPLSYSSEDVLRLNINLSVDSVEMYSLIGSVKGAIQGVLGGAVEKVKKLF